MKRLLLATSLSILLASCAGRTELPTDTVIDSSPDTPLVKDVGPEIDVVVDAAISDAYYSYSCPDDASLAVVDGSVDFPKYPDNYPMIYEGGKILTNPVNVYFIWYGDWGGKKAPSILSDLISNIDSSPWYKISTLYYQNVSNPAYDAGIPDVVDALDISDGPIIKDIPPVITTYASNKVTLAKSIYVGYSHGLSIHDTDIPIIVKEQLDSNTLPTDVNGIYFVITSINVVDSDGLCTQYCGWHNSAIINETDIKFSLVGDTEQCPDSCSTKPNFASLGYEKSPNEDWSADGMASVMLHELAESVADPDPMTDTAWIDGRGAENADKCAWTFGTPYVTNDGCSLANIMIGSRNYMIQQNWTLSSEDKAGGHCALSP